MRLKHGLIACASTLGLTPSVGASEASSLALSWNRSAAAEDCPEAAAIERSVARYFGASPFRKSEAAAASTVAVSVDKASGVYRANIELFDAAGASLGSRSVQSSAPTCESLAAATSLAIALMIEAELPQMVPSNDPPAPRQKPPPTTRSRTETAAAPGPPRSAPDEELEVAVLLGAVAAVGVLPRPALGGVLRGEVELGAGLNATAAAQYLGEQVVERDGARAGFSLTTGSLGVCHRARLLPSWALLSCVSVVAGALQIAVQSPTPVDPGGKPWWAPSAGLNLAYGEAAGLELRGGLDAWFRFARRDFLVDRAEPNADFSLFRERPLTVALSLAAGVRY